MSIKHLKGKTNEEIEPHRHEYELIKNLENKSTRVYLFNITVHHGNNIYENKNILYFSFENAWFSEKFILENRLSLSHIFCHASQSFGRNELEVSLSTENNVRYLVSDNKLRSCFGEPNNEGNVVITDNLTLHCIKNSLNWLPFESEMKTFLIIRH